ncbi:hypothetical protein HPB51_025854 [Rhipicephalus microplus]|uniref:Uncharacterized protein n=1 Tax=Rhipicephalus microplus TaxID=6941 RepID=A0A9J6F6I0_RHIMP|nr:hypothetical protein HPB51_025854 [Rhipicephalus microplus]
MPAAEKQVSHDTSKVVPGPSRSHPGWSCQPQQKGGRRRTRARTPCGAPPPPQTWKKPNPPDSDPPLDYASILQWYREHRQALFGTHPWLGRREGVILTQLQIGTVLTPTLTRHVCPGLHESAKCSICARELATLTRVWGERSPITTTGHCEPHRLARSWMDGWVDIAVPFRTAGRWRLQAVILNEPKTRFIFFP